MFKRKLFKRALSKRVLPLILSVAMAFQSMPATALAAEDSAVVETGAEEAAAADSDTTDSDVEDKAVGEADSPADGAAQQADTPDAGGTDQKQTPEGTGEAQPSSPEGTGETQPSASEGADEMQPSTPEGTDEAALATPTEGASAQTPDTSDEGKGTTVTEPESEEEMTTEVEMGADAGEEQTDKAVISLKNKNAAIAGFQIDDTAGTPVYVIGYDALAGKFDSVIGTVRDNIKIEVNGEDKSAAAKEYLTFAWKTAGEDGNPAAAALSGLPQEAGSYFLEISLEEVKDLTGKVEKPLHISFRIEKAKIVVEVPEVKISPETAIADYLEGLKNGYSLKGSLNKDILDKDTFVKEFTPKVFEVGRDGAETEVAVKAGDKTTFDRQKDYRLKVTVTLKDEAAKNYEAEVPDFWTITVGELKETKVVVTLSDPAAEIVRDYDEKTPAKIDDLVKTDSVKVMYKDADGREAEVELNGKPAAATAAWYTREQQKVKGNEADRAGITIEEDYIISADGYQYIKCDDPVDTGEYYVIYKFDGDDGHVYAKSVSDPVKVTIRPLSVIIVPEAVALSEGMKEADIRNLLTHAGYTIYYAKEDGTADTAKKLYTSDELGKSQPDFFGVSYSGDDAGFGDEHGNYINITDFTQYYSPVFQIRQRFVPDSEKDGEGDKNWVPFTGEVKNGACEQEVNGKKVKGTMAYQIRFTGQKAVYDTDGNSGHLVYDADDRSYQWKEGGIAVTDTTTNSAEKNRVAAADEETLDKNAVNLTVTAATKAEINTDDIKKAFAGAEDTKADGSLEAPLWKIYNGAPLYKNRSEYKKAKLKEGTSPAGTDESFTYTWQYLSLDNYTAAKHAYVRLSDEEKEEYPDFKTYLEKSYSWSKLNYDGLGSTNNIDGDFTKDRMDNNIVDARVYRLHIAYEDKEHKNLPSEADVYFMVKQMEVLAVADKQKAEYGNSVNDFRDRDFTLYMLKDNKEPAEAKEESLKDLEKFERLTDDGVDLIRLELERTNALTWKTQRLEKDADGKDTDKYISLPTDSETVFTKLDNPYHYEAFVTYEKTGVVESWTDGETVYTALDPFGWYLNWSNYTNIDRDKTLADENGATYYHTWPNVIEFNGEKQLRVEVDALKMPSDRPYNGEAVTVTEGLVKIFDGDTDKTADLLNTTGEYNPDLVNIEWEWQEAEDVWKGDKADWKYVTAPLYGGTYTLRVSFNGNETYRSFDTAGDDYTDDDISQDVLAQAYSFRITPLEITITPVVNKEVTAGDKVGDLISGNQDEPYAIMAKTLDNKDVPVRDSWIFEYGDMLYDWSEDKELSHKGFALLKGSQKTEDGKTYWDTGFTRTAYTDNDINSTISEANLWKTYLKSGRTYTVKYTAGDIRFPYNTSYSITYKYSEPVSPARGASWVGGENMDVIETVDQSSVHSITPRQAVPFVYEADELRGNGKDVDGRTIPQEKNYVAFRIFAPMEFAGNTSAAAFAPYSKNFVYKNSIRDAGGYVLTGWSNVDYYDYDGDGNVTDTYTYQNGERYIVVLFPVTRDENGKNVEIPAFNITWENGYTESFKLNVKDVDGNDILLEANLKKAVAPKSLAFNGVNAKMTVGDTQSLDVKVTKAQLGDVVKINYRLGTQDDKNITKNDFASIDPDKGVITALNTDNHKPVKVSVEAYPVYLADDGTMQAIKGAKAAKTTITISDVTAPVIKKIDKIEDDSARLQFTLPDNGYRREIYVVELKDKADAKNWKNENFETKIAEMKNGQWQDTFAIAPIFISGTTDYSAGRKMVVVGDKLSFGKDNILGRSSSNAFSGFKANTNYAVYVRNVSAARTLDDGSKVALSAGGSVKAFATTKAQVRSLQLYFDQEDEKNPVKYGLFGDGTYGYLVNLSDKSAQLNVRGYFKEKEDSGKPAAENHDQVRFELPIKDKTVLNTYLNPKLSYAVYDQETFVVNGYPADWKDKDGNSVFDPWLAENAAQSKYATISNKGKLSLKGVGVDGEARVWIYVRTDNGLVQRVGLRIVAKADTLTAKPVKMKVGDTVRLADYLEYKLGKAKVPCYRSSRIEIAPEQIKAAEEAGYEVTQHWGEAGYFDGEWTITAVKYKDGITLSVTDTVGYDAETGEPITKTADVRITSGQLDPVKGVKAVYVDDRRITLNFAHAGSPEAFAIEVKDARNNVVYSSVAYNDDSVVKVDKYARASRQNQQKWILRKNGEVSFNTLAYFEKTKTYSYTIESDRIVRLSSYTISVTPLFRGEKSAKPATTKAKTTNIPAARDENVETERDTNDVQNILSGLTIVSGGRDGVRSITRGSFVSGNTYTLSIQDVDSDAKDRVTDTLTWKSSNTKVAAVKANPGTYTASLKAVQKGRTTITVTSKITKKVIARWAVSVKSVGNGDGYRGDFEYGDSDGGFYTNILPMHDPYYDGRLEVLTVSSPLIVNSLSSDRVWISFTAPSFGEYSFRNYESTYYIEKVYDSTGAEIAEGISSMFLEAGQKIYFRSNSGSFKLHVNATEFDKLTTANSSSENGLAVKSGQWISFTATEKNYYTFAGVKISQARKNNSSVSVADGIALDAGETVFIKTQERGKLYVAYMKANEEKLTTANKEGKPLELTFAKPKAAEPQTQYVSFTAPATAKYTFTVKDASETAYYQLGTNTPLGNNDKAFEEMARAAGNTGSTMTLTISKDTTVMIKVTVTAGAFAGGKTEVKPTISVEQSGTAAVEVGKDAEIPAKTTQFVEFKVPVSNDVHQYTFIAEKAKIEKARRADGTVISDWNSVLKVTPSSEVKGGDIIYLEVVSTDNDAAGSLKVTDLYAKPVTVAGASENVKDNEVYWYTFTADKAGYYTFSATAAQNEGKATHTPSLKTADEVFGTEKSLDSIKKMNLGEKLIIKLNAGTVYSSEVTTSVNVSIGLIDPTPLSLGETGTTVSTTKQNETKYYMFTAPEDARYTFTWTSDAESAGSVQASLGSDLTQLNGTLEAKDMKQGKIMYVSVKQTTADAAKGTIKVTTDKAQTLAGGEEKAFDIKAGGNAYYRFTVPNDNLLGWAVSVSTTAKDENTPAPSVSLSAALGTVNESSISGSGSTVYCETRSLTSGKTYTLTVKALGDDTKGTIKIEPVTAADLGTTLEVTKQKPSSWYKTTIGESGRYSFEQPKNADGCMVYTNTSVVRNGSKKLVSLSNSWQENDESYFEKGDVVYVKAYNTTAAEKQTASIKAPERIKTGELKLNEETKLEATKDGGTVAYYLFTPSKEAAYGFETTGTVTLIKYLPDESGNDVTVSSGEALEAGEAVFIKLEEGASVKVTEKAEIKALENGKESGDITIKAKDSAYFSYQTYEKGIYTFKGVSDAYIERVSVTPVQGAAKHKAAEAYKGFYYAYEIAANKKVTLTVTNDSDKDIKVNVTASKVILAELTLDKEEPLTIQKGEAAWVTFRAPLNGTNKYKFVSGSADARIDGKGAFEKDLNKDGSVGPYKVTCVSSKADVTKADAKVMVTAVKAADIKPVKDGDTVSVAACDIEWRIFTADKSATYSFEAKDGEKTANIKLYRKISGTEELSGAQWLEEGGQLYVRIDNSSVTEAAQYKFTAAGKEPAYIGRFELPAKNVPETFEFTVPETGTYKYVGYTSAEEGTTSFMLYDENKTYIDASVGNGQLPESGDIFLVKGEKVKLNVERQDSNFTVPVYIRAELVQTPTPITDTEESYLLEWQDSYFMYTATVDGTYIITANEEFRYGIGVKPETYFDGSELILTMKKGQTVLLRVTGNYSITLKITKLALGTISTETSDETYTLAAQEEAYHELVAEETARYQVTFEKIKDAGECVCEYYGGDNRWNELRYNTVFTLATGEKVQFRIRNNATAEETEAQYKLKVEKTSDNVEILTAEGTDCAIAADATVRFIYQAQEEGLYTFKGVSDVHWYNSISIEPWKTLEHQPSYDDRNVYKGFYRVYRLDANDKVILTVTNSSSKDIEVNASAVKVTPTELTLDEARALTVQRGEAEWVTFKAPLDGNNRYKFTSGSNDAKIGEYDQYAFDDVILEKNESTEPYKVTCANGVTEATAKVKVSAVTAEDITSVENGSQIDIAAHDIEWLVFTARDAASYSLGVKADDGESRSIELYRAITDEEPLGNEIPWLETGKKIYIRVDNAYKNQNVRYRFTATGKDPVYSNQFTFKTANELQTFEFTAPETGDYKYIAYPESGSAFIKLYTASGIALMDGWVEENERMAYPDVFLMEGEKVTLKVTRGDSNLESPIYIRVQLQREAVPIRTTGNSLYSVDEGNNYFAYTAAEDGKHILNVWNSDPDSGDLDGEVYYSISKRPFVRAKDMELLDLRQGETVIVKFVADYDSGVGMTIKRPEFESIGVGTQTYSIAKQPKYYMFKPEDSGVYTISLIRPESIEEDFWQVIDIANYDINDTDDKTYNLSSGDEVFLEIYHGGVNLSSSDVQFQLEVKKVSTMSISNSQEAGQQEIEAGATKCFELNPLSDGWYRVSYNANINSSCYYWYSINGEDWKRFDSSLEIRLNADEKLLMRVENQSSSKITVTPEVEKYAEDALDNGTTLKLSENDVKYLRHTVDKDGQYMISYEGISGDGAMYYFDGNVMQSWNKAVTLSLRKGESIFFKVKASQQYSYEVKLSVENVAYAISGEYSDWYYLDGNSSKYFNYTATADNAVYSFSITDSDGTRYGDMSLYYEDESGEWKSAQALKLNAGDKVYLKLVNNRQYSDRCPLYVKTVPFDEFAQIDAGASVDLDFVTREEKKYLAVKVKEAGIYQISGQTAMERSSFYVENMQDGSRVNISSSTYKTINVNADKDSFIYIKVYPYERFYEFNGGSITLLVERWDKEPASN